MKEILKEIIGIGMSLIIATSSEIAQTNFKDPEWLSNVLSYDYVNQVGPEVIRCLKERDREGLNDLFCDKVKDTDYLQKEMDFLFNYIDSNGGLTIEEGAQWTVPGEHGSRSNKGEEVVNFFGCLYWGEVYIGTKRYSIWVNTYAILKKYPEYIGVGRIIFNEVFDRSILTENEKQILIDKANKGKYDSYLGFSIFDFSRELCNYTMIIPSNIYKIKEYKYDDDELEEGCMKW